MIVQKRKLYMLYTLYNHNKILYTVTTKGLKLETMKPLFLFVAVGLQAIRVQYSIDTLAMIFTVFITSI